MKHWILSDKAETILWTVLATLSGIMFILTFLKVIFNV